mmetsp:Transcript_67005/g.187302  ORF Transcript_67005/g.187302 Transcript_67005/m.187302 type:complete len:945 (+) Transcript_67005:68-2902(+)
MSSDDVPTPVVVGNDAFPAATALPQVVTARIGPCALGAACTAKDQELSDQYRCSFCNKQLHGFSSECSVAKNPKDFRNGVICKEQPCLTEEATSVLDESGRTDGASIAAAAGLPKFLWDTQGPKRKRPANLPKVRRNRYTKEQKAIILTTLHDTPGAKLPDIAKQFNVPEGTVRGWFDDERRQKAAGAEEIGDISDHILDPPEDGRLATTPASTAGVEPEKEDVAPDIDENPKKRRRHRYSNEVKIQVILALETRPNSTLNEVAKEFNVAPGTVRGWREESDKIQKAAMENRRVGAKANPSKDPLRRVWEAILSLFEKNSRLPQQQRLSVNVAVVKTIGKQARDILLEKHVQEPFLTDDEVQGMQKFKASETWARKWAKDHQVMSTKPDAVSQIAFAQNRLTTLQNIVAEYIPERVYTLTTTSLFYRVLPHRTYVSKVGQTRVRACKGLKCKDRLTLYLCTNESGTEKLPITCIGKYENPACFQVAAQKNLPYLSQKQALTDAGTYQRWWRTVFLPHVRSQLEEGEKCLLLVDDTGMSMTELLRDPTGQVRIEALPPSQSNSLPLPAQSKEAVAAGTSSSGQANQPPTLPPCQPLEFGILETIKRRYRYRLLQEVMDAFDERAMRRRVAASADFPMPSRGLREGNLANVGDGMRLLESIWNEVATTTIVKAWQRTKLRSKSKEEIPAVPPGQRIKSEKRQTTREKKQLVKDLYTFLTKHESKDFTTDEGANDLEEMIEKLKNCFLYTDGEVIESKEMMESLEDWIVLEDSQGMVSLFMEEIKTEMNIEYLVGLKEPLEATVPEAEEGEDPQTEPPLTETQDGKNGKESARELDLETALELASTIKSTACKLFAHGDILGELAVRLDDASDSVFRLLRKQKELANAKQEADKAKVQAKSNKAKAQAAASEEAVASVMEEDTAEPETSELHIENVELPDDMVMESV